MRTVIVRFTRNNAEDIDFAVSNFSEHEDNPEMALLSQFKYELNDADHLKQSSSSMFHHYTDASLIVWISFLFPERYTKTGVIELIQQAFDLCGVNGSFEVVDSFPKLQDTGNEAK
jgi:hypothetical protein